MDLIVNKFLEFKLLATVFCYGHTSAGKTFTMFGNKDKNPGIIPLTFETIFAYIYEVF